MSRLLQLFSKAITTISWLVSLLQICSSPSILCWLLWILSLQINFIINLSISASNLLGSSMIAESCRTMGRSDITTMLSLSFRDHGTYIHYLLLQTNKQFWKGFRIQVYYTKFSCFPVCQQ